MESEKSMITVFKPKFEHDQWVVEIVCIQERSIYNRYFSKKKKADKFYKLAKKKAKKDIFCL